MVFRKIYEEKPTRVALDTQGPGPVSEKAAPSPPSAREEVPSSNGPRRIRGELRRAETSKKPEAPPEELRPLQPLLFFSSLTGSTERMVKGLLDQLEASLQKHRVAGEESRLLKPQLLDLAEVDYDEYFISPPKTSESGAAVDYFYLLVMPSYNIDTINDNFLEHLQETHNDFRIDTAPLSGLLGYTVFGLGDREGWPTEEEGFCFQAKEVDKWMSTLR